MQYAAERAAVIAEAKTWVGTPYHHAGQVKGAGVDCLTLLACVYANAGVIDRPTIPYYTRDWYLHREEELYLGGVMQFCDQVEELLPADIAVWKIGRCYSHGAIVVDWPLIIHAHVGRGTYLENVDQAPNLTQNRAIAGSVGAPVKFFRLKRWM